MPLGKRTIIKFGAIVGGTLRSTVVTAWETGRSLSETPAWTYHLPKLPPVVSSEQAGVECSGRPPCSSVLHEEHDLAPPGRLRGAGSTAC